VAVMYNNNGYFKSLKLIRGL